MVFLHLPVPYMDVEPKIVVFYPPKWMVKIMENPIKIDDLGVPLFLETPIYDPGLAGTPPPPPM